MPIRQQITVPIANQPGTLSGVAGVLGAGGVTIEAMTVFEGQVHLVPGDPARAGELLREAGYPCIQAEILQVDLPHKAGALAGLSAKLASGGVNVNYAYSGPGSAEGTASIFMSVSDLPRAVDLA